MQTDGHKRFGRRHVLVCAAIAFVAVATWGARAVFASFTAAQTANHATSTGSVTIGDNDTGSALFSLSGMTPADAPVTRCINVTTTGNNPSEVHLYASVSGSLAAYVSLTVTRGTDSSPSFASCSNFTPDATDYIGGGAGVMYAGQLSTFASSYGGGYIDPTAGAPESWTQNESHSYKFTVSLLNDAAAEGLSSSATFTWEARNP